MVSGEILFSVVALVGYVVASYSVGRLVVSWITAQPTDLARCSSPLIGAALFALQLWLYGAIGLPWNGVTLLAPWFIVGLVARRPLRRALADDWQRVKGASAQLRRLDTFELVLTASGVVIGLSYLLNLVTQPLTGIDAIAVWLFKAKLYYTQHAVDLRPIIGDVHRNLDYPPLFSLMVSTLFALIGRADDILGKSVNFLFFLTATATFFTAVRSLVNRQLAVTLTFLLVATPIFSFALLSSGYMGWADYPFGILMLISLTHLLEGARHQDAASFGFAVIFAAMAALTKNEGLPLLAIILLLVAWQPLRSTLARRAVPPLDRRLLLVGALAIAPVVLWQVYIRTQGLEQAVLSHRDWRQVLVSLPARTLTVVRSFRRFGSFKLDYPWLAAGFILSILLVLVRRSRFAIWVYAALLLQLASYFASYLVTPYDLDYILATTLDRLIIQVTPSLLFVLAVALNPHVMPDAELASASQVSWEVARAAGNRPA